jgi:hypothetical protein
MVERGEKESLTHRVRYKILVLDPIYLELILK